MCHWRNREFYGNSMVLSILTIIVFLEKTEFINASKHQNKLLLKSLKRNDRHELTFSNKKW